MWRRRRLPARSPNLNAYAERFVKTIKSECLSKLVPLSERDLRKAISEFVLPYHLERNHRGIDNKRIVPRMQPANENTPIRCHDRLVACSSTTTDFRPPCSTNQVVRMLAPFAVGRMEYRERLGGLLRDYHR